MELASFELLHMLERHYCHNTAYQDSMGWFSHYRKLIDTSETPCSETKVNQRSSVLKAITKKYDVEKMKPMLKNVKIDNERSIEVTTFDFKQQLLYINH